MAGKRSDEFAGALEIATELRAAELMRKRIHTIDTILAAVCGQSRDPLGRSQPGMGMIDTGDVQIPDKSDLQRAREILDELRRRAGEPARPKPRRDYIRRPLQRF
jgi:hypothetical protein